MADPVTVTTPAAAAAKSALAAGATAAAQTVVKNVKSDVKAEGASRPWVLVACSFAAGALALFLAQHFLHLF